jgi:hypothetical protein
MTTNRITIALTSATAGAIVALTGAAALRGEFTGYDTYANGLIPICDVEDCSDKPNQIGVWYSPRNGHAWLSVGEESYRVSR